MCQYMHGFPVLFLHNVLDNWAVKLRVKLRDYKLYSSVFYEWSHNREAERSDAGQRAEEMKKIDLTSQIEDDWTILLLIRGWGVIIPGTFQSLRKNRAVSTIIVSFTDLSSNQFCYLKLFWQQLVFVTLYHFFLHRVICITLINLKRNN